MLRKFSLLLILLMVSTAYGALYQKQIVFVDEFGDKITHTTLTSVSVYDAGTTDLQTIYSDRAGKTSMTNPIVTGLSDPAISFFSKKADFKITATDGTYTRTVDNMTSSDTRFAFPTYLVAMSSRTASDSQTYIWGSDSDVTSQWIDASDAFRWTPSADGIAFNLGVSGTTANWDFNIYTGTGVGFLIDEGASTLGITGLTTSINASSNYATNINTGTSTGAVTIGSSTSGAWAIDGTTTGTINADDSIDMTTSGAAADIDIDAAAGSLILDGGEAAADAVSIVSAGGIDIAGVDDFDWTLTSGTDAEDFTITLAGATNSSLLLASSGTSNDAISLITSAGGIDLTVAGAAAGEDLDLTSNTAINLTSSEAADLAINIATSNAAGQIQITSADTTVDGIEIDSAGGMDIDTADDITIDIAGEAGQDLIVTNTGGSMIFTTTEADVADAITLTASNRSIIDVKAPVNLNSTYCLFEDTPIYAKSTTYGGACTGTAGDENTMMFPGATFLYHIIGTQSILGPTMTANGFDIAMDLTANEGLEITPSILGRSATGGNKQTFIIDTDAFYLKVKIYMTDVSGTDDLLVGFRKVEAFQAAVNTYTDYAALKLQGGDIYIESDLNGGAAASDDTTDNWGDTTAVTLGILVDVTGAVTYTIDGSAPTSTQAFTFDTTDVVTPFIYMIHDTDIAEATYLQSWECGLQY